MIKHVKYLLVLIACATLISGCAKKEMVRSEEIIPAGQSDLKSVVQADDEVNVGRETVADDGAMGEEVGDNSRELASANPLGTIYFDFDSYLLSNEARQTLDRNAEWLRKNLASKVHIEGHCDERGSDAYNLALGERRAKSVLQYLQTLGIHADRLTTISYGEEKPAVDGHDESSWVKNRRAELIPQR